MLLPATSPCITDEILTTSNRTFLEPRAAIDISTIKSVFYIPMLYSGDAPKVKVELERERSEWTQILVLLSDIDPLSLHTWHSMPYT
jgi:hypothetical protein